MSKEKRHYIDGNELVAEVLKSKEADACSERLGELFIKLTNHILQHQNFSGYPLSLKEDMRGFALEKLMKAWPKVAFMADKNIDKARVFSYFTRTIFNAYLTILGKHYKQENIKRDLQKKMALELLSFAPKSTKKILDSLLNV